ncbi:MAG: hypothetical protein ICV66_12820, partial [Chitinophagaceae bacterium]|nr:hypothetical protein [Chitinophagaceae bacterium]
MNASANEFKLFAKLYLIETKEKNKYERELIKQRKTSRLHYDGRKVSNGIIQTLSAVAAQYGHSFI